MRSAALISWFLGLLVAAGASWLIWTHASDFLPMEIRQELRFGVALLPLILWAMVPVVFSRQFFKAAGPQESPTLRGHRRAAIAFLANRGVKGRRGRYARPFFLLVGPPGSGKSSILERSDMRLGMPMTIGNATWWVGPEAVFIETTFGMEEAVTREVYDLLRSLRPKLPVNATLLTLSPADLTLADLAEQRSVMHAVTNSLRMLDEVTKTSIPSYLLLSKTDLVPGFREFFDRYEPQEREQPWGFILPYETMAKGKPAVERHAEIDKGFQDLLAAMRARHMEWLSREADPVRCGHLQGFSAQIAALQKTITPLLENLAPEHDRNWKGSLMRGIFLTSARQEPLSIDALLPELSRRFAMPRIGMLPPDLGLDEEDQGYFITGVLKRIVIPEAGLVLRGKRRGAGFFVQWALIAATVLACLGSGYWIFRTFDEEIKFAGNLSDRLAGLKPVANPAKREDLPALLQSFRQLRQIEAALATPRLAVSYPVPGLSVGPQLDKRFVLAERGLRVNALVFHLAARLEADLIDVNADVETLRKRLAVATDARNVDSPILLDWVAKNAASLAADDKATLESEAPVAIREAGGLRIGPSYLEAARRLIAYKESLT